MAERSRSGGEKARSLSKKLNPNVLKTEPQLRQEIHEKYHISWDTITHLTTLKLQQQQQNTQFDNLAYRELLATEIQEKATDGEITVITSQDTEKEYHPDDFQHLIDIVLKIRELHESTRNQLAHLKDTSEADFVESQSLITAPIYSSTLLERARHPEHAGDQIVWMMIGVWETIVIAVTTTGQIIWGIIKSPYDLYRVWTGKAQIESNIDI